MKKTQKQNKVLVAPLNWGLGHATRCVPVIKGLLKLGFHPVVATDGQALVYLKKEFPLLEFLVLPSYKISYTNFFWWGMLCRVLSIIGAIVKECLVIKRYIKNHESEIKAIISDNRLGVYHKEIPSIYLTHQTNIKAGWLSGFVNRLHHYFIKKHSACWVPDVQTHLFSGDLSRHPRVDIVCVGVLSRLQQKSLQPKYDLLVLLSGIEGQRKVLEQKLMRELASFKGKVLWVRGCFDDTSIQLPKNIEVVSYLLTDALEKAINTSKLVLCRSGYSTIMDLVRLNKPAFLIPTPGQTEQEYLADYLRGKGVFSSCLQKDFKVEMLKNLNFRKPQDMVKIEEKNLLEVELQFFLKKV